MFTHLNKKLFTSPAGQRPEDPQDLRLGDHTEFIQDFEQFKASTLEGHNAARFLVLGYPDDRGVTLNLGRTGAAQGPEAFRKVFYRLTPPISSYKLYDLGDFDANNFELGEAHQRVSQIWTQLRAQDSKHQFKAISIGGGHDWALADYLDLVQENLCLINIDAHLDMRIPAASGPQREHSGTGFRHLIEASNKKGSRNVAFYTLGLQAHCNQAHHLAWASENHAQLYFLTDLRDDYGNNCPQKWTPLLDTFKKAPQIALSICLDAFSASQAPGVSAPQVDGFSLEWTRALIRSCAPKIVHLGLYELNPSFDRDQSTARLAALLAHDFISS